MISNRSILKGPTWVQPIKKEGFNPDHEFIKQATEEYFKTGGKITLLLSEAEQQEINILKSKGAISLTVHKSLGPY